MLYFAATTLSEHRRAGGQFRVETAFLLADDPQFRELVLDAWTQISALSRQQRESDEEIARFERFIANGIAPYNIAGLCDPEVRNMYRYTAIEKP
jgi:tetracycline 7-halogenase / FADH2 O2-dependent halogenase